MRGAVTAKALKGGAVSTKKLRNAAVTPSKLADDAVERRKIKASAVTKTKIAAGAVEEAKLADGAVSSAKIADGTIGYGDIAPAARGALAWGHVDDDAGGTLLAGKNVVGSFRNGAGTYCIDLTAEVDSLGPHVLVVSPESATDPASGRLVTAEWDSTPSNCPGGQHEVAMYADDVDDLGGLGNATAAFSFVVP